MAGGVGRDGQGYVIEDASVTGASPERWANAVMACAPRRRFAGVVACDGEQVTLDAAEPVAGAYAEGVLRWFGGANTGPGDGADDAGCR